MENLRVERTVGLCPAALERAGRPRAKSAPVRSALARAFLGGLAAMHFLCSGAMAAPATNSMATLSLDTFKLIVQRNIFDVNRRGGGEPRVRVERKVPKIEAFSLVGTMHDEDGIGIYAFFDGTGSEFRKVCQPGEMIGAYKVTAVTDDSVKLEGGESPFELPTGMQMRKQDAEKWQLVVGAFSSSVSASTVDSPSESRDRGSDFNRRDRGASGRGLTERGGFDRAALDRSQSGRRDRGADLSRRDRGSIASETPQVASDSNPPADSGSGASADEILKRLMQKREQELNK